MAGSGSLSYETSERRGNIVCESNGAICAIKINPVPINAKAVLIIQRDFINPHFDLYLSVQKPGERS